MTCSRLALSALLCLVGTTAAGQPTCEDGDRFDFEVGVFLPTGSPTVRLTITDLEGSSGIVWEGDLAPTSTVAGSSGCHWAGHVGESSPIPGDTLRAVLPANTLLRFDFETPSRTLHFDYQLCRGAGAPFESFRCPQDALSAEPNDTHALFVYKNSSGIDDIWVVIPTFMQGTTDTFDQLVSGVYWVLPYDLEEACDSAGCDPGETELESPYLRRETFPKDGGFFPVNPNARWVIRSGRKVTWNAADVYASVVGHPRVGRAAQS